MNEQPARGTGADAGEYLEEESLLARLQLAPDLVLDIRDLAERTGASLEAVLICEGLVSEDRLYRTIAEHFDLPFADRLPVAEIRDSEDLDLMLKLPHSVRLQDANSPARTALVPQIGRLHSLRRWLNTSPSLRRRLLVTTPGAMRDAVWTYGAARRLASGIDALNADMPEYSARTTLTGAQGFWFGAISASALIGLVLAATLTTLIGHLALSLFYMSSLLFRLTAHALPPPPEREESTAFDGPYPVYTVLVALYREAEVVPQLIAALRQLDWPKARLDIKLVCEASDPETLAALSGQDLPPFMEVVRVPHSAPKTKPKALNYALSGARGAFITIYDAEDRPHPGQLKEAYAKFCSSGPEIACLQAPLEITNGRKSWLSGLFAADYAVHFRRILPFLSANGLPVPLGGTSNHFRREALEKCGAWDPYNVTEDADLGLRLRRLGYTIGTITLPTAEDAPTTPGVWLRQRTRWFKGWLQTFLVSMRNPARLYRELGVLGLLGYLLNTCGMLVSALFHPLLFPSLAILAWRLSMPDAKPFTRVELVLILWDYANLLLSYAYFAVAGIFAVRTGKLKLALGQILMIPAYWLMLSIAAWLAVIELYRKPHFWAKTPHGASTG